MAEEFREVRTTRVRDDEPIRARREVVERESPALGVGRVIYIIFGVILSLLAFRVLLSLMGANRGSPFADFIYSTSYPFVAPFFGLFNYDVQYGVSRFEIETVFAMLVYSLIAILLLNVFSMRGSHHYHYR